MQTRLIEKHIAAAEELRRKLQAEPGTPANRIVLKPGMTAQRYNPTIRALARKEKTIARLMARGLE